MLKSLTVLLVTGLFLTNCGGWRDSKANPGNWFGGSRDIPTAAQAEDVNPLIPARRTSILSKKPTAYVDHSVPITRVTQLRVERTNTGAIIHATGVGSRQGMFEVRLKPDDPEQLPVKGVLSYSFRVHYPQKSTPAGAEATRRVNVAISLTHQQMEGVRTIRVSGAENARESRR